MVFGHPETFSSSSEASSHSAYEGRMGNHAFFLMLRAVKAYQERYRPKLVTLDLNLIESRMLLVLNDFPGSDLEELVVHLHTPMVEAREALHGLTDRQLIKVEGQGYSLSEAGRCQAEKTWSLAEARRRYVGAFSQTPWKSAEFLGRHRHNETESKSRDVRDYFRLTIMISEQTKNALQRVDVHRRAIIIAIIVGTILNCINQGPDIMAGDSPMWIRMGLTYCVPYCVSVYSAVTAARLYQSK